MLISHWYVSFFTLTLALLWPALTLYSLLPNLRMRYMEARVGLGDWLDFWTLLVMAVVFLIVGIVFVCICIASDTTLYRNHGLD